MNSRIDEGQPCFTLAGGEMDALIRAHDWASTPVGLIAG